MSGEAPGTPPPPEGPREALLAPATPTAPPEEPREAPDAPPEPEPPQAEPAGMARRPAARDRAIPHLRATALFLAIAILVTGVAYPLAVTAAAEILAPGSASGSLLTSPNGTVVGSSLIGQNITAPYLFWLRPSMTGYNTTLGDPSPPGPTDPALYNETQAYVAQYGMNVTADLPLGLVSVSGSGLDPDLTPAAVLVQIPRVHAASGLSESELLTLVNGHIQYPPGGLVGPQYVNVLELDLDLLHLLGRA